MESANKLTLDLESNPVLAQACSGCKPGDKITFEITGKVADVNDKALNVTIQKVVVDEDYDEPVAPAPEEPIAMQIGPSEPAGGDEGNA